MIEREILTIVWVPPATVRILDQTRLPHQEVYRNCQDVESVAEAIRSLRIRGAPAIGVAGAMGYALGALAAPTTDLRAFCDALDRTAAVLRATRPTAQNLFWSLDRMRRVAEKHRDLGPEGIREQLIEEACRIREEDITINRAIGHHGHRIIRDRNTVLTHCNTGALATAGYGTALGVIRAAWEAGTTLHVLVDETRPVLQGARLTTWELQRLGIPATLITDSAAGHFIGHGQVSVVIVGADRIARNGDVANKIGTYTLAVLCQVHRVPFYVAAPLSTVDPALSAGEAIPIEERRPEEITRIGSVDIAPRNFAAANVAFDVTPAALISGIITERGIALPPLHDSLAALMTEEGEKQ